jgi:hypothetical protein
VPYQNRFRKGKLKMTFRTVGDTYTQEIEDAREAAGKALQDYSRGRVGIGTVNAANQRLADAHAEWRRCYGLNVPQNGR